MRTEKRYVLLDVGGSSIKGTAVQKGEDVKQFTSFPSCAKGTATEIFANFAQIIKELGGEHLAGVGFAFPGPFNYQKGISLIKGLDKYDAIYGQPIKENLLMAHPEWTSVPFLFLHDIEAFALGCLAKGEAARARKALFLCIGTGAGSAFSDNGKLVQPQSSAQERETGVPQDGWIYRTEFRDSIIDDYISIRGLKRLARAHTGEELDGLELFKRCQKRDAKALATYQEFGALVLQALEPFFKSFGPDMLVLGGRIAGSFSYFGQPLTTYCKNKGITISIEPNTSLRAAQGLVRAFEEREQGD